MSERIEERLRRAAQTYRKLGNHTAEVMFLEAADTLTELRGALQVASVDYRHLSEENAKLRELVRGLHMAYVGALNECESMDAGLIWDHCEMVDAELAKSHARFEVDRHRFDAAMSELGIEVDA